MGCNSMIYLIHNFFFKKKIEKEKLFNEFVNIEWALMGSRLILYGHP
jgi:hypothetical protein